MEDVLKFVRGFSITAVTRIFGFFLSYVAALIVINFLDPEEYGMYSLAYMVPSISISLLLFGMDVTVARFVSNYLGLKKIKEAENVVKSLFTARIIILVISFLFLFFFSGYISKILGKDVSLGIKIFSFFVAFEMLRYFFMAILQGYFYIEERAYSLLSYNIFFFFFVILFLLLKKTYLSPIFGVTFASFLSMLFSLYYLKKFEISIKPKKFFRIKKYIRFGAPVYISSLSFILYVWTGIIVISFFRMELEILGNYRAAFAMTNIAMLISYSLTSVLLPYFSELEAKGSFDKMTNILKKLVKYTLIISIPAFFGTFLIASLVIKTIAPKYVQAIPILKILSFLLVLIPLYTSFTSVLTSLGRTRELLRVSILLVVLNTIFSLAFGKFYSVYGISFGNIISMSIVVFYQGLITKKYIPFKIEGKSIVKIIFSSFIMAFFVFIVLNLEIINIVKLAISIAFGILVYGISVLKTKAFDSEDVRLIISMSKAFGRFEGRVKSFFEFLERLQ